MKKRRPITSATVVMDRVNAQMGMTVVGFANDPRFSVRRATSGSLAVDRLLGGGFPRGRHTELFGDYGAGKSYVLYRTFALAQERGEVCALLDGEKVFDEEWFKFLGGNPSDLMIWRPRTAEQAIKILQLFAQKDDDNPGADIVGIDSVASLLPKEELEKDVEEGDDRTAGRARMMSRLLRRVTTANDDTAFIWTNQLIDKVGRIPGTTTPGGRALKFYTSVRIEMKKLDKVKKARKRVVKGKVVTKDVTVGQWVAMRAEKQKTGRPEAESMIYFDYERRMIDPEYEIIHLGLEDGLIVRSGNTFSYEDSDEVLYSGTESRFRKLLRENEEVAEELRWAISERSKEIAEPTDNDEGEGDGDE